MSSSHKLSFGEKLAYGAATFPTTCTVALTGYLLFYYTDVFGISASAAGTLMLVVRVWDAIWDLIVGRWVDTTRTAQGQARPFLRWAGGVMLLSYLLAFHVPDLPPVSKLVYACVTFTAMQMAYSLVNIPHIALMAALTPDHDERTRIAGINSFMLFLIVMLVGAGTMPLVQWVGQGEMKRGFSIVTAAYGCIGALLMWNAWRVTRERVPLPALTSRADYAKGMSVVFRQRAWRALGLIYICTAVGLGMSLSSGVYYFRYVVGKPDLVGPFMGLGGVGLMVGVVLSDLLTRRLDKRHVCVGMLMLASVLMALICWLPPENAVLVLGLNALANLALGASAPVHGSMTADTIDNVEFHSGQRLVGAITSTLSFATKVGAGIGGGLPGLILGAAGYVPGAEQQLPAAQQAMVINLSVLPALFFFAAVLLTGFYYPLSRADLQRQQTELTQRRAIA